MARKSSWVDTHAKHGNIFMHEANIEFLSLDVDYYKLPEISGFDEDGLFAYIPNTDNLYMISNHGKVIKKTILADRLEYKKYRHI